MFVLQILFEFDALITVVFVYKHVLACRMNPMVEVHVVSVDLNACKYVLKKQISATLMLLTFVVQ